MFYRNRDVCLSAKIRILKQITTDTNFKANHNIRRYVLIISGDVCLSAKIRILKQITTVKGEYATKEEMFVLAQRYEF